MEVLPKQVRAARAFLYGKGITANVISPHKFARSAKELNKSFNELLKLLAGIKNQGQDAQGARQRVLDDQDLREAL